MNRIPTYIDRYPAKMISRLADELVSKYAAECSELMDPFCGSGAILAAGSNRGLSVAGMDVNPYAVLLSRVKLHGFDKDIAEDICDEFLARAKTTKRILPITWDAKHYWFTDATIRKYEQLRYVAKEMNLNRTREGRSVLLAYALSVRRCSRADQRSPKPFISKSAIERRKGIHFDPMKEIRSLFVKLSDYYGEPTRRRGRVACLNITSTNNQLLKMSTYSHVITSPPYINAQDYFRNFKLELHLLEQLLPFSVKNIRSVFIGTERGELLHSIRDVDIEHHKKLLPQLIEMEVTHSRLAAVVHRYLYDMGKSFDSIKTFLREDGVLVLACGDNLVGGYSIPTWQILNVLLEERGFVLFDSFGDQIDRRWVPPKRNGHKGLIKQEVISAFHLSRSPSNRSGSSRQLLSATISAASSSH